MSTKFWTICGCDSEYVWCRWHSISSALRGRCYSACARDGWIPTWICANLFCSWRRQAWCHARFDHPGWQCIQYIYQLGMSTLALWPRYVMHCSSLYNVKYCQSYFTYTMFYIKTCFEQAMMACYAPYPPPPPGRECFNIGILHSRCRTSFSRIKFELGKSRLRGLERDISLYVSSNR